MKGLIKTASWFCKQLPSDHVRISISRSAPSRISGYKRYSLMQPGEWFRSCDSPAHYFELYWAILERLDPEVAAHELTKLAGPGNIAVLCCWETPLIDDEKWCHRGIVSAWFWEKIKLAVPELGFETSGHGWNHPKLHSTLKATDA